MGDKNIVVAIHQPNFFPWLGFFDKMRKADIFVFLDNVQFTKGGYQNRVQIKGVKGPQWLTVPVLTKGRLGQLTLEVKINNTSHWRRTHLKTFETLYRRAPFYNKILSGLEVLYNHDYDLLVDFTIPSITWVCQLLGISTKLIRASELGVQGSGSQLLLDIVKAVGGNTYLSGPSGRNYLDISLFKYGGISVEFHSFIPFEYSQLYPPFVPGLSVLDYLFNMGIVPWW